MHGDEGRTHRHFGLAEANVAADETVHRPAGREILPHRLDGVQLVLGFIIGETGSKLIIEPVGRDKLRRMAHETRRCDADKLIGHVEQALLELGLAHLPCAAAELVERCLCRVRAVTREEIDVFNRQKQLGVIGIVQFETGAWCARRLDGLQSDKTTNAVFGMNDERALVQTGHFRNEIRTAFAALGATDHAVAENILLADNGKIPGFETGFKAQHRGGGLAFAKLLHLF